MFLFFEGDLMDTVILWTKELKVVDNKLVELEKHRHVILVGEKLAFEISIKEFKNEPRCLAFCTNCTNGNIEVFEPNGCDDLKNMRSVQMRCKKGEDIYSESECGNFLIL